MEMFTPGDPRTTFLKLEYFMAAVHTTGPMDKLSWDMGRFSLTSIRRTGPSATGYFLLPTVSNSK